MPQLTLHSIDKTFPGVKALDKVNLSLEKGEVLAIIGENGAGKSTIIKVLGGVHQPDQGSINFEGNEVNIPTPSFAKNMGIGVIYQELNIIPALTVQDNLFLGSEQGLGVIPKEAERKRAKELLELLGNPFSLDQTCSELSIAQQQLVEIAKSLLIEIKVLVMDEPTASLSQQDVDRLFDVIRKLTNDGISIIYISHKLEEIELLADRVMIMRDGKAITTRKMEGLNRNEMIEIMVGRKMEDEFPTHKSYPGETVLEANNISWQDKVKNVSFSMRQGEILGIAGLVGAGRTELVRLIAGAEIPTAGTLDINGNAAIFKNPKQAIEKGIGLIPEDRKDQGLVIEQSVSDNFDLLNLSEYSENGWVKSGRLASRLLAHKEKMSIKYSHPGQAVKFLSGGNQQKLVIAKWLEKKCDLFIFDEPTRGIDVGAKYEIYEIMISLVKAGKSILMVSSELPELFGISDRILVMKNGELVGKFDNLQDVSQEDVMKLCF